MAILMKSVSNARHEYEVLRIEHYHTKLVSDAIRGYCDVQQNQFDDLKRSDGFINFYDLIDWFDTTELILNERHILRSFVMSKMPVKFELSTHSISNSFL